VPAPTPPVERVVIPAEQVELFAHADVLVTGNDPEPAIFGGGRPARTPVPTNTDIFSTPDRAADPAQTAEAEHRTRIVIQMDGPAAVVDAEMDEVRIAPLSHKSIQHTVWRTLAMWPVALLLAVVLLGTAGWSVNRLVSVETYVSQQLDIANYTRLSLDAQKDLQRDYTNLYRSKPVRQKAASAMQKRNSQIRAGFLENGLALHRSEAITFSSDGKMTIRVDSGEPENDLVRLQALSESFYDAVQARQTGEQAALPEHPNARKLTVVDTRPAQRHIAQMAYVGVLLLMGAIHYLATHLAPPATSSKPPRRGGNWRRRKRQ
jgi:hypothetical protein